MVDVTAFTLLIPLPICVSDENSDDGKGGGGDLQIRNFGVPMMIQQQVLGLQIYQEKRLSVKFCIGGDMKQN